MRMLRKRKASKPQEFEKEREKKRVQRMCDVV